MIININAFGVDVSRSAAQAWEGLESLASSLPPAPIEANGRTALAASDDVLAE